MRGPDAHSGLIQALEQRDRQCHIASSNSVSWASATFAGARHNFVIEHCSRDAANRFIDGIGDHDFNVRGHIVADIELANRCDIGGRHVTTIAALTVEDA